MASAASLSSAEKAWIEQGVGFGVRGDGRSHLLVRPSFVETGILVGTVGSARVVRAGTDVVVGVKPELCDASVGRLLVHVECSSASAPPEAEGKSTREYELVLAQTLSRAMDASFDATKLVCAPGLSWTLYVDCLVRGQSGGALLDVLSLAVRAALGSVRLPVVTPHTSALLGNQQRSGRDFTVTEDPHDFAQLDASDVPVWTTVSFIGSSGDLVVLDTSRAEESCCTAQVAAAFVGTTLCATQQTGTLGVEPAKHAHALSIAQRACEASVESLVSALRAEHVAQRPKVFVK